MPSPPTDQTDSWTDLSVYTVGDYTPGRGLVVQLLWYYTSLLLFESAWLPASKLKLAILRCFGARIGQGVVLKPNVRIKFPWRLQVGDHCWIGQQVWIDNIAPVRIGSHVCISQGVYFCTGNHDHRKTTFDLIARPITVASGAWVAARSLLLAGVNVGANALVAAGAVVTKDVAAEKIVGGSPARELGDRERPAE